MRRNMRFQNSSSFSSFVFGNNRKILDLQSIASPELQSTPSWLKVGDGNEQAAMWWWPM